MKRLFLVGIMILVAASYPTKAFGLPSAHSNMSDEERSLWNQAEEEERILDESGFLYVNPRLESYLDQVARKLEGPDGVGKPPFRMRVLKDPHLNAFSFPNRIIYLHSGILARMQNEAQLAILLGHEMAHCTQKHALKMFMEMKDERGYPYAPFSEKREVARDLVSLLGPAGFLAAISGYTRELETEADLIGLEMAEKAGYDLAEGLRLFQHLKKEIEINQIKEPFFFGTHPRLQKRIENCKRFIRIHQDFCAQGIKNAQVFLAKTQGLVLENARLDLKAGRFSSAKTGVEKYLAINPNDARVYFVLGEIFRQRGREGDLKKALRSYETAIFIAPFYPEPHEAMGLIYYKEGQKQLAKVSFETCLALSPDMPDRAYIKSYVRKCSE